MKRILLFILMLCVISLSAQRKYVKKALKSGRSADGTYSVHVPAKKMLYEARLKKYCKKHGYTLINVNTEHVAAFGQQETVVSYFKFTDNYTLKKNAAKIGMNTICGVVRDKDRKPIKNVKVSVKNTGVSTKTNHKGYFSIEANKMNEIVFHNYYYKGATIQIGNSTNDKIEFNIYLADYNSKSKNKLKLISAIDKKTGKNELKNNSRNSTISKDKAILYGTAVAGGLLILKGVSWYMTQPTNSNHNISTSDYAKTREIEKCIEKYKRNLVFKNHVPKSVISKSMDIYWLDSPLDYARFKYYTEEKKWYYGKNDFGSNEGPYDTKLKVIEAYCKDAILW